jgi:putative mycofactocin binding protein MftB
MDLNQRYRMSPHAAIRPERFGGLIYRYDNRRLYFLYSRDLVDFMSGLDGARPLAAALDTFLAARALPDSTRQTFIKTLAQLEKLELLDVLHDHSPTT